LRQRLAQLEQAHPQAPQAASVDAPSEPTQTPTR
jgi:hypothetical protein